MCLGAQTAWSSVPHLSGRARQWLTLGRRRGAFSADTPAALTRRAALLPELRSALRQVAVPCRARAGARRAFATAPAVADLEGGPE